MKNILMSIGFAIAVILLVGYFKLASSSVGIQNTNVLYDGKSVENAHWSPDGTKITFVDFDGHLWLMDIKTRKSMELIADSNINVIQSAWVSPTQLVVAEIVIDPKQKVTTIDCNIVLRDITTSKQTDLFNNHSYVDTISVDHNNVYLGESMEGVEEFDLQNPRNLRKVEIPMVQGADFKLSRQGDKIAFLDGKTKITDPMTINPKDFMFIYDLSTRQSNRVESLRNYKIFRYALSPDGRQIAFMGKAPSDPYNHLYITSLDQSKQPIQIMPKNVGDIEWSPTGDTLLIETVGQPGHNQLMLLPIPHETK